MNGGDFLLNQKRPGAWRGWLLCLLALPLASCTGMRGGKSVIVPTWGRFEETFHSTVPYTNALQQATLTVLFISPFGDTNRVDGFWDGGDTWRVRFSPGVPGRWYYETVCSDSANNGLQDQAGDFLCSGAVGMTRFQRHGPVRVARDHRHFEHADGTPFFWLADCTWIGALQSESRNWESYAAARAGQGFSAIQWSAAPGRDRQGRTAYTGKERIAVDPVFFRRLDAKVEQLNAAGLLSVICPLGTTEPAAADALPAGQMELLLRYMAARWGANDVAWLLTFDGENAPEGQAQWLTAGREVFGADAHAPVIVFGGVGSWSLDPFRREPWVDILGYGTGQVLDEEALQRLVTGASEQWAREPARPLINVAPPFENGINLRTGKRIESDTVRRVIWQGLMQAPSAGATYGEQDVAYWDTDTDTASGGGSGPRVPRWQSALVMPGAKEMALAANIMTSVAFWRLLPSPQSLVAPPPGSPPLSRLAAVSTESKSLGLIYVPGERSFDLSLNALPPAPTINWMNLKTGATSPAVAVVAEDRCQFPVPEPGDWLLIITAGK